MIKSHAKRYSALIVTSVLLTVTESSHQYASLEEIRLQLKYLDSSRDLDTNDPFAVFRAAKLLFQSGLCDGVDVLGAASGLLRAKNKTDILINLDQEDADFLLDVGNVLEQLEDQDNPIKDLDKICDNPTGLGSSRNPVDSFCFVDVENYFLKTEVLDKTLEITVLYDVLSENDLYEILSNIKSQRLMHMYEIYRDYLEDFPKREKEQNLEFHNKTITQEEINNFINTLHFGREGKLYFPSEDSKESRTIERKLAKLGLVKDSDYGGHKANLQISTYGLGGYISPHYDTYTQPGEARVQSGEDWAGTVMGYLTTPHQGGHTVFPNLGLSVQPVAGSVLTWRNVDRVTREVLEASLHAGCPVRAGEKWIFNKWVLSNN